MIKKTRKILFLTCLFLFALIAPAAILYSQGYRIDFNPAANGKIISRTGGLFLKVSPRQADIFIDGKLKKRTDFFFGSALIENLLPKKYKVEVKKEKYHSWEKILEIKEKQVSEAKNIILFPKEVSFNVLSEETEQFWISPDQKKIIIKIIEENNWILYIYDSEKNEKNRLISAEDIEAKSSLLIDLDFSKDSKEIYLKIGIEKEIKYFTLKETGEINPSLIEEKSAVNGNGLYRLDENGHLLKDKTIVSAEPFLLKEKIEYDLKVFQDFIFLSEENGNLYKFNPELKIFEVFFEEANCLKPSPNNKKLLYSSDYEIWILFLSESSEPPQKSKGEKLLLIRLSEKISDIFWLNDNYLIFIAGKTVKISEIDNRDKLNITNIFEIKNLQQIEDSEKDFSRSQAESLLKMFWNQSDKKIYLLKEKTLYSSSAILP